MKTLIVGDIHGRLNIVKRALTFSGRVVFVGDILDSFTESVEDQVECLKLIRAACAENPSKVVLLRGNHEASYLFPQSRCSGFNTQTYYILQRFGLINWLRLRTNPYCLIYTSSSGLTLSQPILITHAGITWDISEAPFVLSDLIDTLSESFLDPSSWYYSVGRSRGGRGAGGPLWCDSSEFTPIDSVRQIFGHTPQPEGKILHYEGGSVCIDVLDRSSTVIYYDDETDLVTELNIADDEAWERVNGISRDTN